MNYLIQKHPNTAACRKAAVELARQAAASGLKPVIVVPSYSHQLAMQRWLAEAGAGFGVGVSTPFSFTEELWNLFGTGQSIVDGFGRALGIRNALAAQDAVPETPGFLNTLSQCVRDAAPFLDNGRGLSAAEEAAVAAMQRYRSGIRAQNLIEPADACALLAKAAGPRRYRPILLGFRENEPSASFSLLLNALGAVLLADAQTQPSEGERREELTCLLRTVFKRRPEDPPVQAGGALRCALASGPSASDRLVVEEIAAAIESGCSDVTVVCPDAYALFSFAAPLLERRGIGCSIEASRKLVETDMGRALAYLGRLTENVTSDPLDSIPSTAADFAFNPFSGIRARSAFRIDRMHRMDRLTDQDTILTDLASSADDTLSGLVNRVEEREYPDVVQILQAYLDSHFSGRPAYHAEQTRALGVLAGTWPRSAGLPLTDLIEMIGQVPVPISARTAEGPAVRFVSRAIAATLPEASTDCVLFAHMSAQDNPIKNPEDAAHTLLAKLGAASCDDQLAKARTSFYAALQAARKRVVLQRPLNDADGNPSQAATVFEEAVDCYRQDLQSDKGVCKVLGVPEGLSPFVSQAGEQDVLANAGYAERPVRTAAAPLVGSIPEGSRQAICLPHLYGDGCFQGTDVSPSQIESYLECPYCWFAKRRLRLDSIDEGFSPMERGTFMHEVLRRFYVDFQNEVAAKVTPENLAQARQILARAFETVRAKQPGEKPGNRYVPLTAWERKEQEAVLRDLDAYLEMEAVLLPDFTPRYFEWQFAKNSPVPYAGCNLRGCIDRIDIDDHGNAVVIDYKSSLSDDYRLVGWKDKEQPKEFQLPKKVQTLVYAKAVRDVLGLNVVGALYVNPLKQTVLGAYDGRYLGPASIPFAKKKDATTCQVPYPFADSMEELMAVCEEKIEEKMRNMAKGVIEPDPSGEHACAYCPVNVCERRLAPRRN